MKITAAQKKEFEDFVDNPYMLSTRNEPGFYNDYSHPWTCGAFEAYKKFVVEPQQTRVLSDRQHEDGVVQMISAFLQRMKSHHGMIVRQDIDGAVVVVNTKTNAMHHLTAQQDKDLI